MSNPRILTDDEARHAFLSAREDYEGFEFQRSVARSGTLYDGFSYNPVSRDFQQWAKGYVACKSAYINRLANDRLPMAQPTDRYGRVRAET